jgi:hypothetical protein
MHSYFIHKEHFLRNEFQLPIRRIDIHEVMKYKSDLIGLGELKEDEDQEEVGVFSLLYIWM